MKIIIATMIIVASAASATPLSSATNATKLQQHNEQLAQSDEQEPRADRDEWKRKRQQWLKNSRTQRRRYCWTECNTNGQTGGCIQRCDQ
jgi:Ni/Co efflux regulator RcnB